MNAHNTPSPVAGSVALITGASMGLGRAVARAYAREGAKLALVARREDPLERTAAELQRLTDVLPIAADVAEDAEAIVERTIRRFGAIDILINNASTLGTTPMPPLESLQWEDFLRILRVNLVAPLHLAQMALPFMRSRGSGVIVNVSSDAAVNAYPGWGGYGASKAALEHLSRILAAELKDSGVRVIVVDPGDMNTEMHRDAEPGVDLGHLPDPAQIAPLFVQLLSDSTASFARYQSNQLLAESMG